MKRKPGIILATAAAVLFGATAWGSIDTARADDFELAMVIKSTTNPVLQRDAQRRRDRREEIGGTVEELRADAVERPGAGRHHQQPGGSPHSRDRGRAERSRRRRAGDEAGAETRRQGHHLRRRFRHGGRPFFVNQATSNSVGRYGAILLVKAMGGSPKGQGRDRVGAADGGQPERLDRVLQGRDVQISGRRDRRHRLRQRQRAEGVRRDRRPDHQISRSRRHLRADLPRPPGRRPGARIRRQGPGQDQARPAIACRASPPNTC